MSSNLKVPRICEYCGKEFIAQTTKTRYCSHTCNSRHYKEKKKAEKLDDIKSQVDQIIQKSIEIIKSQDFLSINEACMLIGVSRWTLWRLIKNGELQAASLGRRKVIRRADIETLFNSPKTPNPITNEPSEPDLQEPTMFDKFFYYTISEAQEKYRMSPKAFFDLLNRHGIQKIQKGRHVYVQKDEVDRLFIITPKSVEP